MLVALDGRIEWLAFAAAAYVAAMPHMGRFRVPQPRAAGYMLAVAVVGAVWLYRYMQAQRSYQVITASPPVLQTTPQ
jgi:hypothetical protein